MSQTRSRLKILLVGAGAFGRQHLRVWRALGAQVYAADLDPAALEACGLPAARRSRDFRERLALVDAVDVATPVGTHFELCRAALRAGKDVFVEKPFTSTSAQARALTTLARRAG